MEYVTKKKKKVHQCTFMHARELNSSSVKFVLPQLYGLMKKPMAISRLLTSL